MGRHLWAPNWPGLQRVCAAWGFAVAMKSRQRRVKPSERLCWSSVWEGEGHRKVWARLCCKPRREQPAAARRGGNPHVGEIITHAPNLMWGTDGVRVFTVDDGWGWVFTAIEHWNPSGGWHVCKRGDRFAALHRSPGLATVCLEWRGDWPCVTGTT